MMIITLWLLSVTICDLQTIKKSESESNWVLLLCLFFSSKPSKLWSIRMNMGTLVLLCTCLKMNHLQCPFCFFETELTSSRVDSILYFVIESFSQHHGEIPREQPTIWEKTFFELVLATDVSLFPSIILMG